jgi:hypothetical protein
MNGKLHANDDVTALLDIHKSSIHNGNVDVIHSSILWMAFFTAIPYQLIFCSNFLPSSLKIFSSVL